MSQEANENMSDVGLIGKKQIRRRVDSEEAEKVNYNDLLAPPGDCDGRQNLVIFLRDRSGIHFSLDDPDLANSDNLLHLTVHEQGLPAEAKNIFALWLVSPLLDLRLKRTHNPFDVVKKWDELCARNTEGTNEEIHDCEPVLMVQRDVFYRKEQEQHIQNEQILCLLYQEAKYNVIEGRYILHSEDYHYLAGIQALIHLGSFDPHQHVLAEYRAALIQFYPSHMYNTQPKNFSFQNFKREQTPAPTCEECFMEAHKRASEELQHIASNDNVAQLYRKYLALLWTYPFYGGAFFTGIVEANMPRWRRALLPSTDHRVYICINADGVTLFNKTTNEFLLYIPYSGLSWEWQDLEWDGDSDPPPTLLLQFMSDETDEEEPKQKRTKLLQIYSRQAKLMDALIESCVRRKLDLQRRVEDSDFVDGNLSAPEEKKEYSEKKLLNKLEKLVLETYSVDGEQLEAA